MKRIISLILLVCVCLASVFVLASCDEEALRELTNKQWQTAVDSNNFNNVTITATATIEEMPANQITKITETGVYRKETVGEGEQSYSFAVYFEGEEAVAQKNMFLTVFFELIKNQSNFDYDEENDQYVAPNDVTVTVYPNGPEGGIKDVVLMQNGIVKFDENYNLSYFSCTLTETIYYGDATEPEYPPEAVDTVWEVGAYGETVISETEKAEGAQDQ